MSLIKSWVTNFYFSPALSEEGFLLRSILTGSIAGFVTGVSIMLATG
jgi:hypothetical protein